MAGVRNEIRWTEGEITYSISRNEYGHWFETRQCGDIGELVQIPDPRTLTPKAGPISKTLGCQIESA